MSVVASIMTGVAAWLAFAFLITGAFYCCRYQRAQAREDFYETQRCVPTSSPACMQQCSSVGFLCALGSSKRSSHAMRFV